MIRAFVAVELSPALREQIASVQAQVRNELGRELRRRSRDVRIQWVRPESLHVTLKFLGDVAEDGIRDVERIIAEVATRHAPFAVEVAGLGVFPELRAPRVLWIGLTGQTAALIALAADVDRSLQQVGFSGETKPFQPHLTVARIKDRGRDVGSALAETGLTQRADSLGVLSVSALSLMKSTLQPSGAVYTRLSELALTGSESGTGQPRATS